MRVGVANEVAAMRRRAKAEIQAEEHAALACMAENHCRIAPSGAARCVDGYVFLEPSSEVDHRCYPSRACATGQTSATCVADKPDAFERIKTAASDWTCTPANYCFVAGDGITETCVEGFSFANPNVLSDRRCLPDEYGGSPVAD
jgi:hypothetical protein